MPSLDWETFASLSGDPRDNFEALCRGATSRTYSRFGRLAALAQQPGVEFHLRVTEPDCDLGDPGRWYGWQTKWWELNSGRPIGATRRADVLDSIEKTLRHVPGITDWVLWTRRPLTKGDQDWFYGLQFDMQLHLWTAVNLDELLIGDAQLLREAYFGDLILTPARFADLHKQAVAEVGDRWIPEVHQPTTAEQQLRRMLAEPAAWSDLENVGREIERFATAVADSTAPLDESLAPEIESILATGRDFAQIVQEMHDQLHKGHTTVLVGAGHSAIPAVPSANPLLLRRLRSSAHPIAPPLTNLLAHVRDAATLAEHVVEQLTTHAAVICGEAGYGKTQLAATLSAATEARHAGILLFGRRLSERGSLDDLASQLTIAGQPIASFDALLAAVDAAAARLGCRLPIVIDGLNEAEVATTWAPLLRNLLVSLEKYPSVLVICTVRGDFVDAAVPSELPQRFEIHGFDQDLDEAIDRYFEYFKIHPGDAELPRELLNHPLSLKIYCTVANPDRGSSVGVERLPVSLTGMFEEYLRTVGRRVYELNSSIHPHDVSLALDALGGELWLTRQREVPEARARELFNDTGRWQDTILAALEYEGLVIRQRGEGGGTNVSLVYDLLAGHVVATSLLHSQGHNIANLLATEEATRCFSGSWEELHALAGDIFDALAGSMPRTVGLQLWQTVADSLRLPALLRATALEADHLDSATVNALSDNVDALRGTRHDLFDRLFTTRGSDRHPLNAKFLDRVLVDRSVADRDLRWSEWLRHNERSLLADAGALATRWCDTTERSAADRLRARWLMWTLTSTDRRLRDAATAALYWFGRHDPDGLFSLAIESMAINDAYIGERVLAACYGITTAQQIHAPSFEASLSAYLDALQAALFDKDASTPTRHALTRYYVSGTFEFASQFYPDAVPARASTPLVFVAPAAIESLHEGDVRREDAELTLRMDFENYSLGRLFADRSNYDRNHRGHQRAVDGVLGVVHALGWRSDLFADAEGQIDSARRSREPGRLERYGKKYGWIGLYNIAGMLADEGETPDRLEFDIDPTFPQLPASAPIALKSWALRTPDDEHQWLREGLIDLSDELLAPTRLGEEEDGPWILVHAEIDVEDIASGRNAFGLFNTVLVDKNDADKLTKAFDSSLHPGRDPIDLPGDYYLFAGEIPWHHRYAEPEPGATMKDAYLGEYWPRNQTPSFERLAHSFNWESYHSAENKATSYVPSRLFSERFDLRSVPNSFDQIEPSGRLAARSFGAPSGFEGELLYVRADLLREYAQDREIVTFAWGERQTQHTWPERPSGALQELYANYQNIWRTNKTH